MDSPPSFNPTGEAAGERFTTWAFNSSPPNNILPPKVLCPYLERGTSDDCSCLAPQQLKPCSASTCRLVSSESRASSLNVPALEGSSPSLPLGSLVPSVPLGSQPPRVSPSSTGLPPTVDTIYDLSAPSLLDPPSGRPSSGFLPLDRSTVGPEVESPEAFFTSVLGESKEKRVKRLVGIVEGFSKAKELPDKLDKSFWSRWPLIFGPEPEVGSEAIQAGYTDRLRRLKQTRQSIRKGEWEAHRLWLICVAHEVEHISLWEGIDAHTSQGVNRLSAATKIVEEHLGEEGKEIPKRCRNIVHLMKEGGPAAVLLDDGGRPPTTWERDLPLSDITTLYEYKGVRFPHKQTKSHDPDASCAIKNCFLAYGWSFQELLHSRTKVMAILRPYFQSKRPHAGDGPGDSGSTNKRWCVDRLGASTSRSDHNFSATSLDQFSPGSIDQATSTGIGNTAEPMPRSNSSHLISFDARNETRDLTDLTTIGNLNYVFNSSDELTDSTTTNILGYSVNNPDEFTDPITTNNLSHAINSSCNITDLDTAGFLQNTHNQSMDMLSNLDYGTDPLAVEYLQWTVNGSDALTDPFTERFLQGATSPSRLYLMENVIYSSHDQHLQNASTPGWIRSTDDEQSGGS